MPDGALWYLPFEALPVTVDGEQEPLGTQVQIRYAPLVSLAVGDPRPRRAGGNTAVVLGKLILSGDAAQATAAFDEIGKVVPGAVALHNPLPKDLPAYATLFDGLIVLNEVATSEEEPYEWSPLPHDQKGSATISNWFPLPFGGPDFVIMPSFHTAAERALKKQNGDPGNEVFLSICALMANGTRTVLLSRWRTGGQSSVDLVREFVQELPHASTADAWQRALLLVSKDTLNAAGEPRLRLTAQEEAPTADHPFFWAGYLLADTGTLPQELADKLRDEQAEKDPAADKPAAKPKGGAAGGAGQPRGAGAPKPCGRRSRTFPTVGGEGGLGQATPQQPGAPQRAAGQPAFGMPLEADAQQQRQQQQGGLPQQVPGGAGGGFNRGRGGATPGGFVAPAVATPTEHQIVALTALAMA